MDGDCAIGLYIPNIYQPVVVFPSALGRLSGLLKALPETEISMAKYFFYLFIIFVVLLGIEFFEVYDVPYLEIPDLISGTEEILQQSTEKIEKSQ